MAILRSAAALFAADGYGPTTVGAVAERAGVSAQTVYNSIGSKRELLKAAYDVTLAGDDEPIPLAERPEVKAMYAMTDAAEFLRSYARLGRQVAERIGPLVLQLAAGAALGEPDLVEHQRTTDQQRLTGTGMVVAKVDALGALAPSLTVEAARDRIWTLNSIEVWGLLTRNRGWSGDEYADWIGDAMCAAILARR
ncbi:helix-turn-helix domain-containing protein [Gordonia sp. PKS22-38]|uniref:Helix-turn-helix domain-containing protein n=1 Tax=Gordonia prachuapensis TaxID=3115651 RepID=A0ABU7MZN4_9ACTN|nr:helix-turn-helix domain-containing protein [Gordonia sp. PKS22-38]